VALDQLPQARIRRSLLLLQIGHALPERPKQPFPGKSRCLAYLGTVRLGPAGGSLRRPADSKQSGAWGGLITEVDRDLISRTMPASDHDSRGATDLMAPSASSFFTDAAPREILQRGAELVLARRRSALAGRGVAL
jgi:hypothetical protein